MWYVKSVGIFVIAAACLPLLGNNAMARGYGQGEHEADSGGAGVFSGGGGGYGYSGGGGGGQGQEGPGGSGGVYVASGIDGGAVGQAQVDGGNGSGYYQSAPAFESSPLMGPNTMIAGQPNGGYQVAIPPGYRYVAGTWFYQMPDNSWVRFENGAWMTNNNVALAQANSTTAERTVASDPHYSYANGTWFYQMPDKHLVRWDNGKWVDDNQTASAQQNAGPIAGRTTPSVERR
jgi:hypothetical protein